MSTDAASLVRSFVGWTPIHIFKFRPQLEVLWSRLGVQRFDDPFFTQTVTAALQEPLARLLQRTTSLDELVAAAEREPAVEPAGFIFHVSRCGSTLVAQMFARLPRIISISEARPLMTVSDDPRLSHDDRARVFRALIRLCSRKVTGGEIASVFKFGLRDDPWEQLKPERVPVALMLLALDWTALPRARNMKPSWLSVEYASTRFRSVCVTAISAAKSAVNPPVQATRSCAPGSRTNSGVQRATR